MNRQQHKATQAFSLVELSIVLVILGLLVGGILSGQSLIRAAELRSVSTEFGRYSTAIGTFRDKYFALPGDMSNATSFWTTNGNGDGDGTVELTTTAGAAAAATNEVSTFWIDLASAGLVEGSYTYTAATSTSVCGTMTAGTNNPKAKMGNAGWNALYLGTVAAAGVIYFDGTYGNVFLFNAGTACGTATATTGVLKPEEAWNIDTKLDDGKPATGGVLSLESQGLTAGTGCSSIDAGAGSLVASVYSLANTSSTACSLVFKSGY
ncbi:MAG: prepilin-type N-terminal cleavage/methylation domain-containing protein [Pseudomonadota bacterium]